MMKRTSAIVLVLALVFHAPIVVAQQADPVTAQTERSTVDDEPAATEEPAEGPGRDDEADDGEYFGEEHRVRIYESRKKSAAKAALLTLALPGFGNIYAEQYFVAGVAFTMMTFSALFLVYGITTKQPRILNTGIGFAVGTYLGAGALAIYGVSDYNQELRQALKVEELVLRELWSPAVTIRF